MRWILIGGVAALLAALPVALGAQERSAWMYYLEGRDFALTRAGKRVIYTSADAAGGVRLEKADILQTETGCFLEVQGLPSGLVIKVSENTSVVYNGYDETGRFTDLVLLYGRVRVLSGEAVVVRAGATSVRLSAGDISVDYTVTGGAVGLPGSTEPTLRVSNLGGGVEVYPYVQGQAVQVLPVRTGEALAMVINLPLVFADRAPLEADLPVFWALHDFLGPALLPLPADAQALSIVGLETVQEEETMVEETPGVEAALQDLLPEAASTGAAQAPWKKNLVLGLGAGTAALGAAAHALVDFGVITPGSDAAPLAYYGGYGALGLGILVTLAGIFFF